MSRGVRRRSSCLPGWLSKSTETSSFPRSTSLKVGAACGSRLLAANAMSLKRGLRVWRLYRLCSRAASSPSTKRSSGQDSWQTARRKVVPAGARDLSRVSRSGKSLCLGKALPAQDCRSGRRVDGAPAVELKAGSMILRLRAGARADARGAIVSKWYREQLKTAIPDLLAKWEPILGVNAERVFVQKMKTKWETCNPDGRSIRPITDWAKSRHITLSTSWCTS